MVIMKSFLYGVVAAAGALLAELIIANVLFVFTQRELSEFQNPDRITAWLVLFVITEEFFKFLLLSKLIPSFQNTAAKKIIFSSWVLGLGFGIFESAFILYNSNWQFASIYQVLLKITLLHTMTAGIIGYWIVARINKFSLAGAAKTIVLASFLHFLFNFLIINESDRTPVLTGTFFIILGVLNLYNFFFGETCQKLNSQL